MRVAALYDIHGNLPALEAVLEDVRHARVDQVVVGGDVVLGPMPRDALRLLRELEIPAHYIRGNTDRLVLAQLHGDKSDPLPQPVRDVMRWTARQLDDDDAQAIASWPRTIQLDIPGIGAVLFCHATPRDDDEIFTRLTPEERLTTVFDEVDASLVVCGHTHMQFDRTVGQVRVVNAGSVGMPFGEPGAYWLLLGPEVSLQRTRYDFDGAAARIRATTYPQAETFASGSVVNPPAEDAMLAAFARAELK